MTVCLLAGGEPSPKVHMSVKVIVHVHACMASLQVEVDSLEYDKGVSAHLGTLTPLKPT